MTRVCTGGGGCGAPEPLVVLAGGAGAIGRVGGGATAAGGTTGFVCGGATAAGGTTGFVCGGATAAGGGATATGGTTGLVCGGATTAGPDAPEPGVTLAGEGDPPALYTSIGWSFARYCVVNQTTVPQITIANIVPTTR